MKTHIRRSRSPLGALLISLGSTALIAQSPWIPVGIGPDECPPGRVLPNSCPANYPTVLDSQRNRLVAFGPDDGQPWVWENGGWTAFGTTGPSSEVGAVDVAFDAVRNRTVWFDGPNRETWEFDGVSWTQVGSGVGPTSRRGFDMTFDWVRGVVLLHGGMADPLTSSFAESDTWTWDGIQWTQVSVIGPASQQHSMTYDPISDRVLLFGPLNGLFGSRRNETWAWDGSAWVLTASFGPTTGTGMLGFDASNGEVLVAAGNPFFAAPGVWRWDGGNWVLQSLPPEAPAFLTGFGFDSTSGAMIGFEGTNNMWSWSGSSWSLVRSATPTDNRMPLAFDRARGVAVLVDRRVGGPFEWNGSSWVRRNFGLLGPRRADHVLVYDQQRGVTTMFGGSDQTFGFSAETWTWNGNAWTLADSGTGPSARVSAAAAYDSALGVIVLHGGVEAAASAADETWIWDGAQWLLATSTQSPGMRSNHVMAYDSLRQRVVLFGGADAAGSSLNDTWEWDGADWTSITTPSSPTARSDARMSYDEARARIVLVGGRDAAGARLADVWEYDGSNWRELTSATSPTNDLLQTPPLTYSTVTNRVLLLEPGVRRTYELQLSEVGRSCTGSAGAPQLDVVQDRPAPGGTLGMTVSPVPATGSMWNLLGFEPAVPPRPLDAIGATGCELLIRQPIQVSVSSFGSAVGGQLGWSLSIPNSPGVVGLRVLAQSVLQDSGANPLGISLTNAGVAVVR